MKTIAAQIYPERYRAIREALLTLGNGDLATAEIMLDKLFQSIPAQAERPEDVQSLFFLNGLGKRLDANAPEPGNLYLVPDQGRQIQMFNFMAERFPLVSVSQQLANGAFEVETQGETEILILDIGMGTGRQVARLLESLAQTGSLPEKVTVIGIEPSVDSLAAARKTFSELEARTGKTLRFEEIGKIVEELTDQDWERLTQLASGVSGKRFVNASFALHHIRPVGLRDALFRKLKSLNPSLIALIEPYADFLTQDLGKRFDNAWHHYGLTFGALDQIDAPAETLTMVKSTFFRREIQDVLAEDAQRTEQFETGEMWAERLRNAGFELQPPEVASPKIAGCPFVTLGRDPGYVGLNVQEQPIISVLIAR